MSSWYKNFAELNTFEKQGHSFRLRVKDRGPYCAIVAPHGGGIEPGTTEIATAIAGRSYSLYTFDGIRSSGNELLHITSTLFDEPRGLKLVQAAERVLAIHGCSLPEQIIFVGGLDEDFGNAILMSLRKAGFEAVRATTQFQGTQIENLCNRGRTGRGVQLEISEGLRRSMFLGLDRNKRKVTRPLFRAFVQSVRKMIDEERTERNELRRSFHHDF